MVESNVSLNGLTIKATYKYDHYIRYGFQCGECGYDAGGDLKAPMEACPKCATGQPDIGVGQVKQEPELSSTLIGYPHYTKWQNKDGFWEVKRVLDDAGKYNYLCECADEKIAAKICDDWNTQVQQREISVVDSKYIFLEAQRAHDNVQVQYRQCRGCSGTGRETDDTPCSNPNYAAKCFDCDGQGRHEISLGMYDRLNAAFDVIMPYLQPPVREQGEIPAIDDEAMIELLRPYLHHGTRGWRRVTEKCLENIKPYLRTPMREIGYRAGENVPSRDHNFAELIAVPVEQMNDIHRHLRNLIALGQTHIKDLNTQPKEITDLKGKIFAEAESAVLFAGNWATRNRKPTEIEDGKTS